MSRDVSRVDFHTAMDLEDRVQGRCIGRGVLLVQEEQVDTLGDRQAPRGDRLHDRTLAGAVGTDNCCPCRGVDAQINVLEAAEAGGRRAEGESHAP